MIAQLLSAPPADAPAGSATSRSALPLPGDGGFAGLLGLESSAGLPVAIPAGAASGGEDPLSADIISSVGAETSEAETEAPLNDLAAPALDAIVDAALLTASRPLGETAVPEVRAELPSMAPGNNEGMEPAGQLADHPDAAFSGTQAVGADIPADAGPSEDPVAPIKVGRRISRGDILSAAFSVMERPAAGQAEPVSIVAATAAAEPDLPHLSERSEASEPVSPSRPIPVAAPGEPAAVVAEMASPVEPEVQPETEAPAPAPSAPGRHADDAAQRPAPTVVAAPAAVRPNTDVFSSVQVEAVSAEPAPEQTEMPSGFEPASGRTEAQPVALQAVHAPASARFRSPLARSVATQLAGTSLEEGSVTIRLRPQGMGVIEIEIARGAQGQMEIAMRVQNPMVLDALRAERSALSDLLANGGARPDNFDLGLFQPGGEGRDSGRENREERASRASANSSSNVAGDDIPSASPVSTASGVQGSNLTDITA